MILAQKWRFFKGKRAFASIVFPQPGGPYIKTPLYIHSITGIWKQNLMFFETFKLGEWFLGGSIPMALYMFMCVRGSSTASRISFFHVFKQSLIGSKISNFDSIGWSNQSESDWKHALFLRIQTTNVRIRHIWLVFNQLSTVEIFLWFTEETVLSKRRRDENNDLSKTMTYRKQWFVENSSNWILNRWVRFWWKNVNQRMRMLVKTNCCGWFQFFTIDRR